MNRSKLPAVLGVCAAAAMLLAGPAQAAGAAGHRHAGPATNTIAQQPAPTSSRHPELSGKRLRATRTSAAVYVIDQEGYRRGVPDRDTYDALFHDWDSVEVNPVVNRITPRPDLSKGAFLGELRGTPGVYLFTDTGRFGIADPATMAKYGFDRSKVRDTPDFVFKYVPELGTWR